MPLTSCQSIMTLAAQKVQKLITNPFIMRVMAINIAPIRSIRLQLCLLCISRSPRLARQAQFCNRTLSLLSGPLKTIMAVLISSVSIVN
jgi:hypothetical protein